MQELTIIVVSQQTEDNVCEPQISCCFTSAFKISQKNLSWGPH